MDIWTIIVGVGVIVGIIAGIVQVVDYLQKRRKEPAEPTEVAPKTPAPLKSPIPHNLPPRREFIGREKEKARVHEALRSRSYLASIDGIGGIGKTVLALEVAHECLRASKGEAPTDGIAAFDGFTWTTAKDRDLTLNGLLDTVARTLEYPGIAQQPVEEKRDAVRKLLQQKPYLLIVDNFETITDEGVRDFLLELPEPSKALITTREQKLRQVWAISLKGLEEPEALTLIRSTGKHLGLEAVEQGDDQVLRHLYEATGGAPLAIKWAVGADQAEGAVAGYRSGGPPRGQRECLRQHLCPFLGPLVSQCSTGAHCDAHLRGLGLARRNRSSERRPSLRARRRPGATR